MARTRSIKPEFWSDEKIAKLSLQARLLFIGMWSTCDDAGRTKGHPLWLKSQIFPYDEITSKQMMAWIAELTELKRITPYTVNGETYYEISNFLKHQKIQHPSPAVNPEPINITHEPFMNDSRITHEQTETETETETEENIRARATPPPKKKFLDSVFLTEHQYKSLQEAMSQKSLDIGIEKLDYSITVKGGKYKDHYKTLLNWFKRGYFNNGNGNAEYSGGRKPEEPDIIDRALRGEI